MLCRASSFKNSRGQLKIQQMAFVLVAIIIFFAMAGLFYFSLRFSSLQGDAETIRERETLETVKKMASSAEFSWSVRDCVSCVDFDKLLILKERHSYDGFWARTPLLQVVRVYPSSEEEIECTKSNYPDCNTITLIEEDTNLIAHSSFVSLCRYETEEGYDKCELGKIVMGFETVQ